MESAVDVTTISELITLVRTKAGSNYVTTLLKLVKHNQEQRSNDATKQTNNTLRLAHDQTHQLLAQVQAFKRLSRNLPMTPDLLQSTGYLTIGACEEEFSSVSSFVRPPTMLQSNSVGKELIASAVSEAGTMAQEKEQRLRNRIQYRLEELKALPTNIVPSLKKKAHIEAKQLKLLVLQKKVRSEISGEVQSSLAIESSFDLDAYRRIPRHADAHAQELEEGEEGEPNEVRYSNQRRFLISLHYHAKEFKEFHVQRDKIMKKLMKQLIFYHREKEKRVQRQEELNKKNRLQKLRENDEEGYRKLLLEAKDERLNTLIQQTDAFLAQMGVLVQRERGDDTEDKVDDKGQPSKTDSSSSKTYYTAAHSIQEEITSQPDMLVGGQLKEYQMAGLQWLISLYNNKLNGILADEMGLGKTIQTIALLSYVIEKKGNNGPFLIAVPLSTLSNWTNEFAKWAPKINTIIYKGKPQTRKQLFVQQVSKGKFNVLMTSFEYIMHDKSDLGKVSWEYLILDEGHRIKNKTSKLSLTLRQYSSKHRLLLTGTPLQNDLGELWSLLNFLLPSIFNSMENFENWFNAPFAYEKTKSNKPTITIGEEEALLVINRLHQVLRPFLLRRLKSDVESQLPDKVERVVKCNLSGMQLVMYKQMVDKGVLSIDPNAAGKKKAAKGFNNVIMQLQKICNHPYLFRDEWDVDENVVRASGKFELMDRMLQKLKATNHRVLIFTQMTHIITIMEEYFSLREYEYLRLDGSTKQEERADMVKDWNRPNSPYFIFVLSTHAGGLGLNLQTADTVIIFDSDWNPHMDLQAADRCHRIGQTQEVRVFRLVCANTVEEKILERANFKLDIDAKIIQAGMFNQHADDEMRRKMLESLMKDLTEATDEDEIVTSNEQLNPLLAREDEELEIFQKMDDDQEVEQNTKRSRLILQDELPAWMLEDPIEQRRQKEIEYGRGFRQRADVAYDDGLTEKQFMKMMERGVDAKDLARKRGKRKATTDDGDASDSSKISDRPKSGSDEEEAEESDEENAPQKRKRNKALPQEEYASEGAKSDEDSPPKKRGRSRTDIQRSTKKRKTDSDEEDNDTNPHQEKVPRKETRGRKPKGYSLKDNFKGIWDTIRLAEDANGRVLSAMFMNLPSAEEYPEYYDVIEQPMSLMQIRNTKFTSKDEFKASFLLIFSNAQEFNMPDSQLYEDAELLRKIFLTAFDEQFNDLETAPEQEVM